MKKMSKITLEKVPYGGWENCLRLSNGSMEVCATTDVGPRLIRCGFVGERNIFKEFDGMMGKIGGDEWRSYGGHRLWHAPEIKPRTYFPDNRPVEYTFENNILELVAPVEESNGILKEVEVSMDPDNNAVHVVHRITNLNSWEIELAAWALSVMAPGGTAFLPQEPFQAHPDALLPVRPMALWGYTNMADPRFTWGEKFLRLAQKPEPNPLKLGVRNTLEYAGYALDGFIFIKKTVLIADSLYPDLDSNYELFTNSEMLEVESLGPLSLLEANGGYVEHEETWSIHKAELPESDDELEQLIESLI